MKKSVVLFCLFETFCMYGCSGTEEDQREAGARDSADSSDDSETASASTSEGETDTGVTEGTDEGGDTGGEGTGCGDAATLKAAGACSGLLIGAALSQHRIHDAGYARTVASEHNYVTAENEMKWERLQPTRGRFTFDAADEIVDFAEQRSMKVKGHCLVWHSQLPEWVTALGRPDEVEAVMKDHITRVMAHFKGKIHAWDVVNEAVVTDDDVGRGNPRMRDTVFQRVLGDGYLDVAFHTAREQDPDVKLYYNDYSIDSDNEKALYVYEMIKGLVERGVPIDGVGFQMHIGTPNNLTTGEEVAANLARFAELGLEVLISEMDINLCGGHEESWQEGLYRDVVAACMDQPACVAVTFWGVNDGSSWLNGWERSGCGWGERPRPLLFDDGFNRKGTYDSVMEALLGR